MVHRLTRDVRAFSADEQGGMGLLAVFWFVLLTGISGIAVDAANGYRHKAMLQATADAAVLAAVIDLPDTNAAREAALAYGGANMPREDHGVVLRDQDVLTGQWNEDTREFIPDAAPADTVMVTVRRAASNDNPIFVSFLRIVGFQSFDVVATAVAKRYYPGCLSREGLISAKRVSLATDNEFINNFCIHGADGVTVQNHNLFEDGVRVTMEDRADFVMPTDGFASNPGLEPALGEDRYDLFILDFVDQLVAELKDPDSQWQPSYIDPEQPAVTTMRTGESIKQTGLEQNRVHYMPCNAAGNVLYLPGKMVYSNLVIVTDCAIQIAAGAQFHNVTMATSFADPQTEAVAASSKVEWGKNDNCAKGGGARVITPGEVLVNAQNFYYSAQFISRSQVHINAHVDGGNGVSVISGEDIVLTTGHGALGLCPQDWDETDRYRYTYFRLMA